MNILNIEFYEACLVGDLEEAEDLIARGANDFNSALCNACYGGHLELVKIMLNKGATCFIKGLYYSCSQGHKEIAKLMVFKGAHDIVYLYKNNSVLRYYLKYVNSESYKRYKETTYEDPVYILLINKVLPRDLLRLLNEII